MTDNGFRMWFLHRADVAFASRALRSTCFLSVSLAIIFVCNSEYIVFAVPAFAAACACVSKRLHERVNMQKNEGAKKRCSALSVFNFWCQCA